MKPSEKKPKSIRVKTAMRAGYIKDYHDCLSAAARICGGAGNAECFREGVNDCKEKYGVPLSPVASPTRT